MASSFSFSDEDIKTLTLAIIVVAAGFSAFNHVTEIQPALQWIAVAAIVVLTRELGQRLVAESMTAYVDVELSRDGTGITLLGAILAYLTQLPIILLFPLTSSFSGKKYEHWGKSIDAIWMKRQFWIALAGVIALLVGGFTTLLLGLTEFAQAFLIFTLFQLMPFDYDSIPTGRLDGAYILRWSGAYWLTLAGITFIGFALTL